MDEKLILRPVLSVIAIAALGAVMAGCGAAAGTAGVATPEVQKADIGGKAGGAAQAGLNPHYKGGNDDARVGAALNGKK